MTDLATRLASALADRYVIERQLGRGGMATVFLARDIKHDRDVAIKVLDPELSAAISSERFHREIHIQARLRHPHVVTLIDSGDAEGLLYYVMTYVEGESLRERLTRGPLETGDAVRLWREVIDGIAYAHRHGVAHRDIKPENVLLTEGHALVADFGVAKALSGAPGAIATQGNTLTGVGVAIGTPAYMAPEQISGTADVDHRADIYALGVIGYEMLAGRPPFVGTTARALFAAHIGDDPTPLEQLRTGASAALAAIIRRCMRKDPDERWRSADELLTALDSLATPTSDMIAGSGTLRRLTSSRRSRAILAAIFVSAVALLATAAYALTAKQARVRWARDVALPEIRRLTDARTSDSAFVLASQAREVLPGDAELEALWRRNMWTFSLVTSPAGARVSWTAYRGDTSGWIPATFTRHDSVEVPAQPVNSPTFVLLKIEAPGAATALLPLTAARAMREPIRLDMSATRDTTMARVPPSQALVSTANGGARAMRMGAFAIDRFEVTNAEYKRFVDAGGYRDSALQRFTDRTGRPGPSTWEGGSIPRGQERYPVSGVSWYEAQAYAKFAGKELPTIHQWRMAAGFSGSAWIVPRSNIESEGMRAVGLGGMGPYGTFDMAGNAREWCVNTDGGSRRHILGGGWSNPPWSFADRVLADPLDRSEINGIRLVKALEHDTNASAFAAAVARGKRDFAKERPVSDAEYRALVRLYDYDRLPLNARIEATDSSNVEWIKETVSFDAAYGPERVKAYLMLPKHARRPLQAVVFLPGGNAFVPGPSEAALTQSQPFLVNSGRAVMYPVLKNTFERIDDRVTFASGPVHNMSGDLLGPNTYRDQLIMMMKDLRRSVDYLTTRTDIDSSRIAYLGNSWGARVGPIALAVEPRFKVGLLHLGGLMTSPRRPEVDEINFLPRVKVPTLLLSGKYDDVFPLDRTVAPYFRLLGAPADRKRQVVYPTQHFLPRDQQIAESLNWLDRYLGAVR